MRHLVYYIATSFDGFIADAEGGTAAFPTHPETLAALFERYPETCPTHLRAALGITGEARRFDTVLMGARTHEPALDAGLTSAYPHLRQYVVTHRDLPADESVHPIRSGLHEAVTALKSEPGTDVWLCGGGHLAGQLIDLIDEIQLKINPVLLGDGVPLVRGARPSGFELTAAETLPGGVLLATYRR